MTPLERHRAVAWLCVLAGVALLVIYVLAELLRPGNLFLPGRDAINLYAWETYTRAVLSQGRLPFWNPYQFAGSPFLADPQTTVLYPPALLLRLLPLSAYLPWMAALHMCIAGAGGLFLARTVGLGFMAAAASAIAVALGGSAAAWVHNGHLLLLYSAAWWPWALGLAITSTRRASLMPSPGLVAVLALQFLTGYLQGSVYIVAAVVLWYAYAVAWPDAATDRRVRWRIAGQLGVVGLLSAGIAAFQLLPTLALVREAGRASGVSYDVAAADAWSFAQVARILYPFADTHEQPPFRELSDGMVYVSWALACLVPFAFIDRIRRRYVLFFALLTSVALAVACARSLPLYRLHYALFPGLRIPVRVLFLSTCSLAMLGAIGLEQFADAARRRRVRPLAICAGVAGLCAAAATAVVLARGLHGTPPVDGWPWMPLVSVAVLIIAGVLSSTGRTRAAATIVVACVVVDAAVLWHGAVSPVSIETRQAIQQWIGPPMGGRTLSICDNRVGAGEMLIDREPDVDGLAAIHLGAYADWAYVAAEGRMPLHDGLFRRIGGRELFPARRDLLNEANVTKVLSCVPVEQPGLRLMSRSGPVFAYRNENALPRAFWTCAAVRSSRPAALTRLVQGRRDDEGVLRPTYFINVRWAPSTSDGERRRIERTHALFDGARRGPRTWRYVLGDTTVQNARSLIAEPAVEDTTGIDRNSGRMTAIPQFASSATPSGSAGTDLLVSTSSCAQRTKVDVLTLDRTDGRVTVLIDAPAPGWVFLSEPYYGERHAFVDGRRVAAIRANVAFTAVPVEAGYHRVELRYVPISFWLGSAITICTAVGWAVSARVRRRRRLAGPQQQPSNEDRVNADRV